MVTADAFVLPDGEQVAIPADLTHLGELAGLAHSLRLGQGGDRAALPAAGQLLLTTEAVARFGIDVGGIDPAEIDRSEIDTAVAAAGRSAAKAAVRAGWRIGTNDRLRVFSRVWREAAEGQPRVSIEIVLGPLAGVYDDRAILDVTLPPAELAHRAQAVANAVGMPWGASGAATGLRQLQRLRPPGGKALAADQYVPPGPYLRDAARVPVGQWAWLRPPSAQELSAATLLVAWDVRAMYLSGAQAALLGIGAPVHHPTGAPFDHRVEGFWRIAPGPDPDWRLPSILRPVGPLNNSTAWYPTPVLRYLTADLGEDVEVLEAYTWPTTSRKIFQRWAENLNRARLEVTPAGCKVPGCEACGEPGPLASDPVAATVRNAISATYKGAIGRLGRIDDQEARLPTARPDWRYTVQAESHTNLLRKLRRVGEMTDRWPVAVSTDEVFYLGSSPDIPDPMKLGTGLGQFQHTRTHVLSEDIKAALTGSTLAPLLKLLKQAP